MSRLEHLHVNVNSLAATERFLNTAVPDLPRRGGGVESGYGAWVHIGNEDDYIALTEVPGARPPAGLRHIGLEVTGLDALMARLRAAGIEPADASALEASPLRRRVYYRDDNGLDREFVEYRSDDPGLRNHYE